MGYDATAIAFIGVQVDPAKLEEALYRVERVRSCDHGVAQYPGAENVQFCSVCGEPLFKEEKVAVAGFDEENEILYGFKLMSRIGSDYEFIVMASAAANANEVGRMPDALVDLRYARGAMRAKLEPMGLFDEEKFGLQVFLHESV